MSKTWLHMRVFFNINDPICFSHSFLSLLSSSILPTLFWTWPNSKHLPVKKSAAMQLKKISGSLLTVRCTTWASLLISTQVRHGANAWHGDHSLTLICVFNSTGGVFPIMELAGKDATDAFYGLHRQEVLIKYDRYKIGTIEGETPAISIRQPGEISRVPYAEPSAWMGFKSPYFK